MPILYYIAFHFGTYSSTTPKLMMDYKGVHKGLFNRAGWAKIILF